MYVYNILGISKMKTVQYINQSISQSLLLENFAIGIHHLIVFGSPLVFHMHLLLLGDPKVRSECPTSSLYEPRNLVHMVKVGISNLAQPISHRFWFTQLSDLV